MLSNIITMGNKLQNYVVFQIIAVICAGLMLGVALILLSPLWVIAGLAIPGLAFVVIKRPEIGLLCYLIITSTFINQSSLPRIPIGIGRLMLTDVILLSLFSLILIRTLVERDFKFIHTPLDVPLLAFVSIAILSTILAIFRSSLTINESLGELRIIVSYLTFFIVTNLVREDRQLQILLNGIFLLATIVATASIAQFILGNSVHILPGRIGILRTQGISYLGVLRIIPPGQSIMMVVLIAVFTILVMRRAHLIDSLKFIQLGILGLAILLTFFRASWGVIALVMLLLSILASRHERRRLIMWVLAALISVTVILIPIMQLPDSRGARLAQAAFIRLGTLTNSTTYEDPNSSLRWRDFEYSYVLPHILSKPSLGLGLGARYRPLTSRDFEDFDGRNFIHNGHVYIMLKIGVFGYLGLLIFLLGVVIRGLRNWRRIPNTYMSGIVLAFALTAIAVLIVSNVEPYVMTPSWTPLIGIIAGINEVILKNASQ